LHLTSEEEARESEKSFPGSEAVVIANGIDIPADVRHTSRNGLLRLVFIGRLDPKKGIENLLAACNILTRDQRINYSLKIAGAGNPAYTQSLRAKIEMLSLSKKVEMLGEINGEAKTRLFRNADVVIVPSHTENFGIVVAEALAHGVPVIASRGTPWKRLEEIGCGLWVDGGPDSLVKAIKQMTRMPLPEMGQRGQQWMEREFAAPVVAEKMTRVYLNLVARAS